MLPQHPSPSHPTTHPKPRKTRDNRAPYPTSTAENGASALLLAGVAEHVVMRRLGHADIQTTMDLYGWVTEDAQLRAVAGWRGFCEGWRLGDG